MRSGVTEVYGDLKQLDDIDWMKISNVDVSYYYYFFIIIFFSFFKTGDKVPGVLKIQEIQN